MSKGKVIKPACALTDLPDVLTVADYADVTGLDPATVRRLCQLGEIPAKKVGDRWFIGRDLALGEIMPERLVLDDGAVSKVLETVCAAVRDGNRLVIEISPGAARA